MDPRPLHIVLTADPELPVPPRLYGGIERIIDLLVGEYRRHGHHVTLVAHPESTADADLVPWPGRSSRSRGDGVRNTATLWRTVRQRPVDVVHSFSRIAYLLPLLPTPVPKLMTYQRAISRRSVQLGHHLSGGSLQFSAISHWMMAHVSDVGRWHLVPNGVDVARYPASEAVPPDAPLVFLGRLEEIKGPHLAIAAARRAGLPLVLAGNVPEGHQAWFDQEVRPALDGDRVRWIGPVDDARKAELLVGARALLMPILWEEPFGIVMAEAMACGTPVLGFRRGAVPEVVTDGETGWVVDDLDQLVAAIGRIDAIDRRACRRRVELHYSAAAIAEAYLGIYAAMGR